MNKPKMILFDYGQTLCDEAPFNPLAGTNALLKYATRNPYDYTAEQIMLFRDELNKDLGRYGTDSTKHNFIEIHNHKFQKYLYEYHEIEFSLNPSEIETVFWNAASPGVATDGMAEFLEFLDKNGIRSGVISNISFSGETLENRIKEILPYHHFEFVMATSEYIFRKPHRRIFELALKKSHLAASDVWYIGDNAFCDVDGAAAVGITPIWYKGALTYAKHIPTVECISIDNWNQLEDVINKC